METVEKAQHAARDDGQSYPRGAIRLFGRGHAVPSSHPYNADNKQDEQNDIQHQMQKTIIRKWHFFWMFFRIHIFVFYVISYCFVILK